MSCSVVAIPWAISWIIAGISTTAITAAAKSVFDDEGEKLIQYLENKEKNCIDSCEEKYIISEKQFLEKNFETPFVDKNLLLKTLEEHGVRDIKENEYGQIRGITGDFVLEFERFEDDKPYSVLIKYLDTENPNEKIKDLTSEYAINVQEQTYNNIVEKLNANNMEIESEEVCDDNTIVLTINLE